MRNAMKSLGRIEIQSSIQFSERLVNVELWVSMADELIAAARIIEAHVVQYWAEIRFQDGRIVDLPNRNNVQGAYFLLIAYGLENYFKATLIHKNQKCLRNRVLTKIPNYLKKHDLLLLARENGMRLAVVEEDILFRLSRNSIWAARYPVPVDPNSISAIRQFSDGKSYLVAFFRPEDIDQISPHRFSFGKKLWRFVGREI